MPKRIQMSRQRPWRADNPDAVIVDRSTRWGNPWPVGKAEHGREHAVEAFRIMLTEDPATRAHLDYPEPEEVRAELAGRDLACWCGPGQACHADVLLAVANPPRCPECRDGKCRNCTEQTLDDNDQWVPCGCPNHGGNS